jgi:UDP-glucose 4-epimerase
MTVLVTGGAGYIGSHMVHALVDAGEPVVVLDNLSTGFRSALPPGALLFVGNAGDQKLVGSIVAEHNINAIIHFAGSIVVPDSMRDPLGYYRNNTSNTRALLESAVKGGVKNFIFSATAAVYGNPAVLPVREDAPTRPMSPYGTSKLMSEIMLHDVAAAFDFRYVILRYFNVAGADPQKRTGQSTPAATHLIKVGIETALGMRPMLDVFGTDYPTPDGTCVRDYIHVGDLVRAHGAALTHLRRGGPGMTFNCGYGHGYSVLDVIGAIERVTGRKLPVQMVGRRPGDPASIVADVSRIHSTLDWKPQFDDLDTIVSHAVDWERLLQQASNAAERRVIPA